MNDEVSVAALLEREGRRESGRPPGGNLRVSAVMLAVVVGCVLAALLVHFGSQAPQADAPSFSDLPHRPTGGLAGGGVPPNPAPTAQTPDGSRVAVTEQAGPALTGMPGTTTPASPAETTTGASPSVRPTTESQPETPGTTGPGNAPSTAGNPTAKTSPPNCRFIIKWC